MARIRSIKPEFWTDLKLSRLSRDARFLYIALWNYSDEHGRLHGDARYVKGHCLPYDDDLSLADVDRLIDELEAAGRVRRYFVDDDPYLHLPQLHKHQRLEANKQASRLPEPPSERVSGARANKSAQNPDKSAPSADESAPIVAQQVAGSRGQVASGRGQGSGVGAASAALAVVADSPDDTAATLVAEWLQSVNTRPPSRVIGHVAKGLKEMLAEGIAPDDLRRGLMWWQAKGLHPSALPSVVNEVMNARPQAAKKSTSDQRLESGMALIETFRGVEIAQ